MVGGIRSTQQPTALDRFNNAAGLNRTEGAQYRITPQNYRQVLGDNADVLLNPQQMKDMFEKGYLDVQRQFTQQESNEGVFTIAAKAMAAFIGPSRSIGAITIDPKFLDMIKDPNAEIGFGYTRLKQETLTSLPYPNRPQQPPPPPPPQQPQLQQTSFDVHRPTQRIEQHRDQLLRFRRQQEQRIQIQGRQTYVSTITKNWPQEEVNGTNNRRNDPYGYSTVSGALFHLIGGMQGMNERDRGRLIRYGIMSAYLDSGSFGSTNATNGTRNGLEMANTVASFSNNFIGTELNRLRGDGAHFEYNKDYGFMTLGSMAREPVGGNPDLEADFVKFKARDLMRTTPGLSQEQATAQAQQFLDQNKTNLNGADLFTLVTQNTTLGEAAGGVADSGRLQERYRQLLVSPGGMSQEQANAVDLSKVTLADFYALQYNASAVQDVHGGVDNGRVNYPPNKLTVTPDGHVQIEGRLQLTRDGKISSTVIPNSQQDALRDVMNMRVVAETNFGRRTGESLMFGPERINNFAAANNMTARLDESDAANVNISVQELDRRLEAAGLGSADGILTRGNVPVNLVPEGLRNNLIHILDNHPGLKAQNQRLYDGLKASPAVVTVADAQKLRDTARSSGVTLPKNMGRITSQTPINTITAQEWQQILPAVTDGVVGQQQARDGQFVVVEPGGEQVIQGPQTPEAEVSGTEMLQLAKGQAPPETTNEIMNALGLTEADIRRELKAPEGPIPPAVQQEYLFKRVMTDVMGMPPEQAATALTSTRSANNFSFPETPGTPADGVRITQPVTTVEGPANVLPDLASVETSLAANLRTMGELAGNPVVILNDTEKADLQQLKDQILSDIATLKANGVTQITQGNQRVNLSDIEAQLQGNFAKIDANVTKGDEAVRARMLEQSLNPGDASSRSEFMANMGSMTATDGRFSGMPPIPRVPKADDAQAMAGFADSVQQSVRDFGQFVRNAMRGSTDAVTGEVSTAGNISQAEVQRMKDWVETSMQQVANSVGLDQNTLLGNDLNAKLQGQGYSEVLAAEIIRTVDMLKDARANVNMVSEGRAFERVQTNISQLSQRLNEFETVGVVRRAFAGEMRELATNNPERFKDVMRGAFQLDPNNPASEQVVSDMLNMAKEGQVPFPANIQFVEPTMIRGANAAYLPQAEGGEPAILLSQDLLNRPADLKDALAEEMFHHMERQTMNFRAEQALAKLPEDFRTQLTATSPLQGTALETALAQLTPDQQRAFSDYQAAIAKNYDVQGDEGRAGLRALRAAQQGLGRQEILARADAGRNEVAQNLPGARNPRTPGDDHGSVTINGREYSAEFQSAAVNAGPQASTTPAAAQRWTAPPPQEFQPAVNHADTGLHIQPNNIHDTGRTYTMPTTSDNPWGRTEAPQVDNSGGTSTHSFEEDGFWGKAREMGSQVGNTLLNYLASGMPGEICEQLARGIEAAWKNFYASVTKNSSIADRSQAEDVVQSGFDVGRDADYEAGRKNLINQQAKGAWSNYWQEYQNKSQLQASARGFQDDQRYNRTNERG